jgi:hypothetical protein
VPEYCTCGAKLPEDARFCHKCGRPTREEPVLVEEAPLAAVILPAPPAPQFPPIGFRNAPAVRAALLSGVLGFLLLIVSSRLQVPAAFALGLVAAGFMAVYLYQRRTGQKLSVAHGAHLGWISGIFGFTITAVLLAGVLAALSDPALLQTMRDQYKSSAASQVDIDQVIQELRSPSGLLAAVALMFLMFTVLPACGGALGAKLLDRE